ncbi:MAG: hypothetical protein ABI598_02080, partial [Chloroflexota bacterium]
MISSLGAMLRIARQRALSDWPIVLAAGLIVTVAATLLAAGTMYSSAVATASLHRALADAPVADANLQISMRLDRDAVADVDAAVTRTLDGALGDARGAIVRVGESDSFELLNWDGGVRAAGLTPLTGVASLEHIEDHAILLSGAWPVDSAPLSGIIPVAVSETVASHLGFGIGDRVFLAGRQDPGHQVQVRIEAIFRIPDPREPFWWSDPQVLEGLQSSDRFATFGPMFTTRPNLLSAAARDRVSLIWRVYPAFDRLQVDGIDRLRGSVRALEAQVRSIPSADSTATLVTALPDVLTRVQRSLLVSRTGVLLLLAQLAILAAYAVLLSAGLLVDHRTAGSALLRSRGAGPVHLTQLALFEGVALVGVAAAAAPWLAASALQLFDVAGPLGAAGLRINAVVTPEAYLAAGGGALLCLVALVLPTALSSRSGGTARASRARSETQDLGRRLGLDVALLAV